MAETVTALRRLGRAVADYRTRLGRQQNQIAVLADAKNRSVIAHLEEGRALPPPDQLESICTALKMPRHLWYPATHPFFLSAMEFEGHLSELAGKSLTLDALDDMSSHLCVDSIQQLLTHRMSSDQSHAHFNSILTFYGERSITSAFFNRFLGPQAFISINKFAEKVVEFQKLAIRLYGSFRQAWHSLRGASDLDAELAVLKPVDETAFTGRRPFESIKPIPPSRLDDLGYISAERVKRESRERHELSTKLNNLAKNMREGKALTRLPTDERRLQRIQTLLRKFGSTLELENTLFSALDADELEREAKRLAPADAELARIEETQDHGRRNLSAYLTEPYMDVYVATSMREKADFISVDSFVEALFKHPEIEHLNLRYFNPTQSWIEDRVAKGLVEALMLRRSRITVYMAQKTDTFGKDSEASVALGQGKPVIVYVPKLFDVPEEIDSELLMQHEPTQLENIAKQMSVQLEEGIDRSAMVSAILEAQLSRIGEPEVARIIKNHWADFDLYGEITFLDTEQRESARAYLDQLILTAPGDELPPVPADLVAPLRSRLVATATRFEARATTFREIHPLALQVILSSGVLNGILVVRDVATCAKVMNRLLTNQLETELIADNNNYRLLEATTRSTLRVISKNRILTNAFWSQYFPELRQYDAALSL